jgi:uncharacterized protein with FMN-binding domain
MRQSAKKVIVAALIVGVFILYSLTHMRSGLAASPPSTGTSGGAPSASTTSGPASSSGAPAGSAYKDGSYTGSVADAQWGYIQVKAVIAGGKITDVQFLQYPNERQYSVQVNSYADPQLTQEAIQAQSAQVDIITGATDSSEAFMQSLSDALSQATA